MCATRQEGVRGSPSSFIVMNSWVESAPSKKRHTEMVIPFSNMVSTAKQGWKIDLSYVDINISVLFCPGGRRISVTLFFSIS